jgi:outer membrane protein OmpA-like peptidoglycan-associated protein
MEQQPTTDRKTKIKWKNILIALTVLCLFLCSGIGYRLVYIPWKNQGIAERTSSVRTDECGKSAKELTLVLDNFKGYAILRSKAFASELCRNGIVLTIVPDDADYEGRMKALANGKADIAMFTMGTFLVNAAEYPKGQAPGTIGLMIDISNGADGAVAVKDVYLDIDSLNDARTKLVMMPESPSEELALRLLSDFSLPLLSQDAFENAKSQEAIRYRASIAGEQGAEVYFLWEPYLSQALALNSKLHGVFDSSMVWMSVVDFAAYSRARQDADPELFVAFDEAYLRVRNTLTNEQDSMVDLLIEDGVTTGEEIELDDAKGMVSRIIWPGTHENYGYFGLLPDAKITLDQLIENAARVAVAQGQIKEKPYDDPRDLYYNEALAKLQSENFHPRMRGSNVTGEALPGMQVAAELPALSDAEWDDLVRMGSMRIPKISFTGSSAKIGSLSGPKTIRQIVSQLTQYDQYYLLVVGHARSGGKYPEKDKQLAIDRANAVASEIVVQGISKNRVRAIGAPPSGNTGASQSVSFVLMQAPF